MRLKFLLLSLLFLLFAGLSAYSQNSSLLNATGALSPDSQSSSDYNLLENDWTFYLDKENKVYYIDFEMINVNLNELQVKNEGGKVILKKSLWNLPVNTLYELDLKHLKPGKYRVVLKTFNGDLKKDIDITG